MPCEVAISGWRDRLHSLGCGSSHGPYRQARGGDQLEPKLVTTHGGAAVKPRINKIHQGDCIELLQQTPTGSIDLAFADPPFNIGYEYDEYDDRRTEDDYLDWSKRWMQETVRVLSPTGTFWLAIGDEYAAELKVMAKRELGLTCRSWVIWYYTFGVHCTHKFTRSHAHLFHFVKDPKNFTFNADAVRVPSARQLVYADKRANPKGRVPDDTWIITPAGSPITPPAATLLEQRELKNKSGRTKRAKRPEPRASARAVAGVEQTNGNVSAADAAGRPNNGEQLTLPLVPDPLVHHRGWVLRPQDLPAAFAADSDTWYFPRVCGTFKERQGFHGCQMPEQLLARIILACTNEGDAVLDPFGGSGTTLAVAKKLKRKYLGFELSSEYVKQIEQRLKKSKPGDPLDGFDNPLATARATADGSRSKRVAS